MTFIGLILFIAGVGSAIYGAVLNNDLEAQFTSLIDKGTTNPGTVFLIAGIAVAVIGLIFLIAGLSRKRK